MKSVFVRINLGFMEQVQASSIYIKFARKATGIRLKIKKGRSKKTALQ